MKETLVMILGKYSWLIGILAILGVEISPIKVSPIKWIFKLITRSFGVINNAIHKDINDKLDYIMKELKKMKHDDDMKDVMEIKNKLINYKYMLQTHGLNEGQYDRCFELIDKYDYYHSKYKGEVNGHMDSTIKYIKTQYENGNVVQNKDD